ncbi:hypothetical protein N505_0102420 [Rhodococcus aetherivorans]|nr:hypothetical protein N505_0102420 [Rhodococcus aetherivorans]
MVMLIAPFEGSVLLEKSECFEAQGSFGAHRDGLLGRHDVLLGPERFLHEHRVSGIIAVDDFGGAAVTEAVPGARRPIHDESARA